MKLREEIGFLIEALGDVIIRLMRRLSYQLSMAKSIIPNGDANHWYHCRLYERTVHATTDSTEDMYVVLTICTTAEKVDDELKKY